MTKIDEGIYKWDKRTTHKFVGGLWACGHPLSPTEGGFDGLHMFGGTHPGDRRNSMVHRGSYLWQYHGAKMVRPKRQRGEKRKISRGLELASQISRWFCGTFRRVKLN